MMILQFEIQIFFAENIEILLGDVTGFGLAVVRISIRHRAFQAGGQRDQAVGVLAQNLHVNARLVVKAFEKARADELNQIFVARLIFRQQNEMIRAA